MSEAANASNAPLKVAIAGLGTVGVGTVKLLQTHADTIAMRCGRPVEVVAVSARDANKDRGIDVSSYQWYSDPLEMAKQSGADLFVELIGGSEGAAKDAVEAALNAGQHVVTANKAMIAHHGHVLAQLAEAKGVSLNFEAAVAGGIPIVKAMREGLAGNAIERVQGILNGTCNYILTVMRETGRDFHDVLGDAQELGYAEADPSFDIDGVDAAHKLAILTALAYGTEINFEAVHVEGIRHITATDIQFADELGYRIKLVGIAQPTDDGMEQRVHPTMVPKGTPIAKVEGVFNAVVCEGDAVDTLSLEGCGAGEGPTASAVLADICDIARGICLPTFGVPAKHLSPSNPRPMTQHRGEYYMRLMLMDEPGVFADVAACLRDHKVSMESMIQRVREPGEAVPVVITTHETSEADMIEALQTLGTLETVTEPPRMIRIDKS